MNTEKQENVMDDSAGIIGDITGMFASADMLRLADPNLYIGAPYGVLVGLSDALARQIDENENRRYYNRMRYAGIIKEKTENTFKWDENTYPLMAPGLIEQALTLDFINEKQNLIMAGPPGVGKSVFAVVLACKALRKEFSVKYRTAHDIVTDLQEKRQGNSLSRYINRMQACDVLVIEDITFSDPDSKTAHDFFSIIDKRYGRKSTVITTNGNMKEWAASFSDKKLFAALFGRLYEEALVMNMNGAKDMRLSHSQVVIECVERSDCENEAE